MKSFQNYYSPQTFYPFNIWSHESKNQISKNSSKCKIEKWTALLQIKIILQITIYKDNPKHTFKNCPSIYSKQIISLFHYLFLQFQQLANWQKNWYYANVIKKGVVRLTQKLEHFVKHSVSLYHEKRIKPLKTQFSYKNMI